MYVVCTINHKGGWPFMAEFFDEDHKVYKTRVYKLTRYETIILAVDTDVSAFEYGLIVNAHKKMMDEGGVERDIATFLKEEKKQDYLKAAFAMAIKAFKVGAVDIVRYPNGEIYLSR